MAVGKSVLYQKELGDVWGYGFLLLLTWKFLAKLYVGLASKIACDAVSTFLFEFSCQGITTWV